MIYNKTIPTITSRTYSPLLGDKNGINKTYTTSIPFTLGTTTVIVNGLIYLRVTD